MVQLLPKNGHTREQCYSLKNHESKYKDNKPVPTGFVYTGSSRNKYQQREYSPALNPKECRNERDITEVIDPRFQFHSSTGGSLMKMDLKEK